jgi:hypothetical protein
MVSPLHPLIDRKSADGGVVIIVALFAARHSSDNSAMPEFSADLLVNGLFVECDRMVDQSIFTAQHAVIPMAIGKPIVIDHIDLIDRLHVWDVVRIGWPTHSPSPDVEALE